MNEQADIIEPRGSVLDAFARATEKPERNAVVTTGAAPPVERVIGAQQVAIRRDEQRVLNKIKVLAAAAGDNWYYRYPVKTKSGGQEWIEGASIKLANDLAREYGNCDIDTRVTDLGDSWLIYARFTDYETGFSMTRPFQQRKGQRGMRTDDARALDIALQIGASKAIRNVIVNALQTFADFAFDEARNALVQKIGRNLEGSRARALEHIADKRIERARVERAIGRIAKDWTAPDIAKVVAMLRSIDDGMTTIDEAFPPLENEPASPAFQPPADTAAGEGGSEQGQSPRDDASAAQIASDGDDPAAPVATIDDTTRVAYERGKRWRAAKNDKKGIPPEFRDANRTREALAWQAGFDGLSMPQWREESNS